MAGADQATAAADRIAAMNLTGSVENHAFTYRVLIRSIVGRPDGGAGLAGQRVIMDAGVAVLSKLVATGTCVVVDGILKVPPEGTKQRIELRVEKVVHIVEIRSSARVCLLQNLEPPAGRVSWCQKITIAAIAQIRNALALATHSFFQEHHFLYVHTPIITTSDCEGAGEMFQVTTLISEAEMLEKDLIKNPPPLEADMEAAEQLVSERGLAVKQLKDAKASKADTGASAVELNKAKQSHLKLDERSKLKPGIPQKDGKIDYTQDFFAR
ncbi:hypothetical protein Goari_027414 [Gossypium aridum]|uniref:WHEP-TRS domain-containing protein n=1 Tax=Gossypium aridum TaxID=34290 RepID=A0A7J8YQR8_GOSAI|nr:hypothetical protein [Gossypium aridum]